VHLKDRNDFDEEFEYLEGIVLYCDKTGTTSNQRYPLEPFIFSLASIRRYIRMHNRAWRRIGFMPDLETKSSSENKNLYQKKQRGKCANLPSVPGQHPGGAEGGARQWHCDVATAW
jgi:hypothetical protein